jgi:hypothetical protein
MEERDLEAQTPGMQVGQRAIPRCGMDDRRIEYRREHVVRGRDERAHDDGRIGRAAVIFQKLRSAAAFRGHHSRRRTPRQAVSRRRKIELFVNLPAPGRGTGWAAIACGSGACTGNGRRADAQQGGRKQDQCNESTHIRPAGSAICSLKVNRVTPLTLYRSLTL